MTREGGYFWVLYFAALCVVLVVALGCARSERLEPLTEKEADVLQCRKDSLAICGFRDTICQSEAFRRCMRSRGYARVGGKLTKVGQ